MTHTLIHLSSSPYSSLSCKEGLDLALVLATFEQPVDLCLSGAALTLLLNDQAPLPEHGKNLHKLLDGLEMYDIEDVYIQAGHQEMEDDNTWSGVTPLDKTQWGQLFSNYQQVFRF